jgi:hypothetical protein
MLHSRRWTTIWLDCQLPTGACVRRPASSRSEVEIEESLRACLADNIIGGVAVH